LTNQFQNFPLRIRAVDETYSFLLLLALKNTFFVSRTSQFVLHLPSESAFILGFRFPLFVMTVRRRTGGDGNVGRRSSTVVLRSTFLVDWRSSLGRRVESRSFFVLRVSFEEFGIIEWVNPD